METTKFSDLMNQDLGREYDHMHFYARSAALIRGPHRNHIGAYLKEQAESELGHVIAFSKKIVSIGAVPGAFGGSLPAITDARGILDHAVQMEREVVRTYTNRLKHLESLLERSFDEEIRYLDEECLSSHKIKDLILFYEEQIEDSHADLDDLLQMVIS